MKRRRQQQQPRLDSEGRVEHAASLDYRFRAYTDCVPQTPKQHVQSLLEDCAVAYNSGVEVSARSSAGGEDGAAYHNKGSTFWIGASAVPRFALEALALQVFEAHLLGAGAGYDASSSGAEWWTQVVDEGDTIGFHWDRDYGLEQAKGLCVYPHLATVTYLGDAGGPTIVVDAAGDPTSGSYRGGCADSLVLSSPSFGKHIKFDGRLLHAAPCLLTASSSRKRVTFLVNVWLNHRPQQARVFPKAHISRFGASLSAQRASAFTGVVGSGNAESAVPTVSLRALLRSSKKTPLDLHRWRFVDGGVEYRAELPLPGGSRLLELLKGGGSMELKYDAQGAEALIAVEKEEEEEEEAACHNSKQAKRKKK